MKKNPKQNCQSSKDTSRILKAIRELIKTGKYREQARQMLDDIDSSKLIPNSKLEYLYIEGRYHYYMFKQHGDIEALEWANDYLDDMASFAYEHKIRTELPMVYTRAYVKFQLSNLVWDEDRKPWLLQKAERITETSLKYHPDNSSFLWLKDQLKD